METPSKENEVIESAGDDLFLEAEEDEYLSPCVFSDNTAEHRGDTVKGSVKRKKRAPLPIAGLEIIPDLVKSGKDISTAGGT